MPTVKRKTGKRAAPKKQSATKGSKPKANRQKTAKKAVKKAAAKKALSPEAKKRRAAAKKAAETRKANAAKAKRSAAAKKAAATRKANAKKTVKKTAAKKSAKKSARKSKKTAKRPDRKRTHVDGRSREAREARRGRTYVKECAKLLLRRKFTDIEIRDKLAETFGEKYSGGKHTRHIRKYRSLLNSGDLEHVGYPRPDKPVQEVGRTRGAEEAGLSRRQVRRRRQDRIDKGLVMGPRARARARRLQAAGISSPDAVGSSSPDNASQPIARRARRR